MSLIVLDRCFGADMTSKRRRCAACKQLRKKCPQNCLFAPYFPSDDPQRFACVHRIYGARNVAKMLREVPADLRARATDSMQFEAQCRMKDPVYGCVGIISQLNQELREAETELAKTRAEIAMKSTQIHTDHGYGNQLVQFPGETSDVFQLPPYWII